MSKVSDFLNSFFENTDNLELSMGYNVQEYPIGSNGQISSDPRTLITQVKIEAIEAGMAENNIYSDVNDNYTLPVKKDANIGVTSNTPWFWIAMLGVYGVTRWGIGKGR